ncbi:hypothetical protein DFJ73DRAFT_946716 [Zopfochytrium polystomum]|nr:hypothetical protein DFJ73DRAFT_946716 [Zopfochytrium polystomum]
MADDKDKYLYRALNDHDVSSLKSHARSRPTAQYLKQVDPKTSNMVSHPSNFISTTTDSEKAKRYASGDFGNGKIAKIDRTKLPQDKIKDLSTLGGRVTHLGSDWDRTDRGPWNHEEGGYDVQKSTHKQVRTRAHIWSKDDKEVLVEGAIPKDCIVEIGGLRRRAAVAAARRARTRPGQRTRNNQTNLTASDISPYPAELHPVTRYHAAFTPAPTSSTNIASAAAAVPPAATASLPSSVTTTNPSAAPTTDRSTPVPRGAHGPPPPHPNKPPSRSRPSSHCPSAAPPAGGAGTTASDALLTRETAAAAPRINANHRPFILRPTPPPAPPPHPSPPRRDHEAFAARHGREEVATLEVAVRPNSPTRRVCGAGLLWRRSVGEAVG